MGVYRTLPGSTRVESNGSDISWVGQDFWVVLLLGSLFGFSLTTGSHSFFFIECDGVSENGLGFFFGGGFNRRYWVFTVVSMSFTWTFKFKRFLPFVDWVLLVSRCLLLAIDTHTHTHTRQHTHTKRNRRRPVDGRHRRTYLVVESDAAPAPTREQNKRSRGDAKKKNQRKRRESMNDMFFL